MGIILKSLKFLAIDCQTSGNSPKFGRLLEIGWVEFSARGLAEPQRLIPTTHLLRQPDGFDLPVRIQKLTGIDASHVENGVSNRHAMDALISKARQVAQSNRRRLCPTVIHFARFEMAFLKRLHQELYGAPYPPLEVICTHHLASKLLPQLPRKGLRAVAGYLGYSVPPLKRCADHIVATAFIWRRMVSLLAEKEKIHTWDQLRRWLDQPSRKKVPKVYPMPRRVRLELPDTPGIYRMKRSNGDVLYIGKAASLKHRVNSYFQKGRQHSEKTLEMLSQAKALEITLAKTALEAALMESAAIKSCNPPYNIALTGNHRKLRYISRDFGRHASNWSDHCPLGPVPSRDTFAAIHAVGANWRNPTLREPEIPKMLAIPESYCPDSACFKSGWTLFQHQYGAVIEAMPFRLAILRIGRLSWIERLQRRSAKEKEKQPETDQIKENEAFVWTPQQVVSSLESVCRRCGFLLRRARWFAILSEATVAWRSRDKKDEALNVIMLKRGRLSNRLTLDSGSPPPQPHGTGATLSSRRAHMDLEIYDGLRVLTTELRRLLVEERFSSIRLRRNIYIYPDQLRILLKWV